MSSHECSVVDDCIVVDDCSVVDDHSGNGIVHHCTDPVEEVKSVGQPDGDNPEPVESTEELCLYLMNQCNEYCDRSCPSCKPRWSDAPSIAAEKARIADLRNSHGIIRRIDPDRKNLTVQIEVQNSAMKKILTDVFRGYPGFHPSLLSKTEVWTYDQPFEMFVGWWDKLLAYQVPAGSEEDSKALASLIATLQPVVQPSLDAIQKIKATNLVKFDDLWLIFPPRRLAIITRSFGTQYAAHIRRMEGDSDQKVLQLKYVDWDGVSYGYCGDWREISKWSGYQKVQSLPVVPLDFALDAEDLKAKFLARGRKWSSLTSVQFKFFEGKKIPVHTKVPIQARGRVMIDVAAFFDSNPDEVGRISWKKPKLTYFRKRSEPEDAMEVVGSADGSNSPEYLNDEQCLLTTGLIQGFDLMTKEWCLFPVDNISDITFNTLAFEKLVLKASEKKLAWAFVESKNLLATPASTKVFDDFVTDKGRGLVMLLCGPPGVGKTYTAEAISEKAQVPLYMLSAGELGSCPSDVEKALDKALELCRKWQAMLLLDEADVFLGKRTSGDNSVQRNELVSIFLRRLEYYQGTMFLTTNKIDNIDDAFQSRIDLILPYGDLTSEARLQVWKNFIEKSGGADRFNLGGAEIHQLALEYKLNGREIKNLVKSSLLIAGKYYGENGEMGAEAGVDEGGSPPVKVSMDMLEALAGMRVRAHKLMGMASEA